MLQIQDFWDSNWGEVFKNNQVPASQGRHQKINNKFFDIFAFPTIKMNRSKTERGPEVAQATSVGRKNIILRLFSQSKDREEQTPNPPAIHEH